MLKENVVCLIPARGGSKGVKRKNIKLINDKPLIAWTIVEAKKSKFIDRVFVSTEDEEIYKISLEYGAEVIKRDKSLALDTTSSVDVAIDFIKQLKDKNMEFDHLILLQCTSPLRTVEHIDDAIEFYLNHLEKYDSLISVVEQDQHPFLSRLIDSDGIIKDFITFDKNKFYRRQDYPKIYHINGAIYIIKVSSLLEKRSFQTDKTYGYIMDKLSSIDIDDEIDFTIAEYLLKRFKSK